MQKWYEIIEMKLILFVSIQGTYEKEPELVLREMTLRLCMFWWNFMNANFTVLGREVIIFDVKEKNQKRIKMNEGLQFEIKCFKYKTGHK